MLRALKQVWVAICVFVIPTCPAQFFGKDTFEVSTPDEFVRAIGSQRTIRIVTNRLSITNTSLTDTPHTRWHDAKGGRGLTIHGVKNLRILGIEKERSELSTRSDAFVLAFEKCFNVDLRHLSIRHERPAGDCKSAILGFNSCTNILIRSSGLHGCGTEGLTVSRVARFEVRDTTIRDCSIGIMSVQHSKNVLFKRCAFRNNGKLYGMDFRDTYDARFEDCEFVGNHSDNEFISAAISAKVVVSGGTWTTNRFQTLTANPAAVKFESVAGLPEK